MAMFLQALSVKAGIATGRDLAQICRDVFPDKVVYFLWIVMEVAIMATDLAEVIGSAIAMKILFGLPLIGGVFVTMADIVLMMILQGRSFRYTEIVVGSLIVLITVCFAVEIGLSKPAASSVFLGFIPQAELVTNTGQLYISVGIIGTCACCFAC